MFFLASRCILKISGSDVLSFLNRLITADLKKLNDGGFIFSALLNSKGRFLFDFFLHLKNGEFFLDINSKCIADFQKTIKYYDLLDEINFSKEDLQVFASKDFLKNWKNGIFEGRFLSPPVVSSVKISLENSSVEKEMYQSEEVYNEERIKLCLPDGSLELMPEKSIIMEYGYEEAGAMSFEKGCYIGQELMTRTKRVGEIRKALYCIKNEDVTNEEVLSSFGNYSLVLAYKKDFEQKKAICSSMQNILTK